MKLHKNVLLLILVIFIPILLFNSCRENEIIPQNIPELKNITIDNLETVAGGSIFCKLAFSNSYLLNKEVNCRAKIYISDDTIASESDKIINTSIESTWGYFYVQMPDSMKDYSKYVIINANLESKTIKKEPITKCFKINVKGLKIEYWANNLNSDTLFDYNSLNSIQYSISNSSSSNKGYLYFDYYLSTDSTISSDDQYMKTYNYSGEEIYNTRDSITRITKPTIYSSEKRRGKFLYLIIQGYYSFTYNSPKIPLKKVIYKNFLSKYGEITNYKLLFNPDNLNYGDTCKIAIYGRAFSAFGVELCATNKIGYYDTRGKGLFSDTLKFIIPEYTSTKAFPLNFSICYPDFSDNNSVNLYLKPRPKYCILEQFSSNYDEYSEEMMTFNSAFNVSSPKPLKLQYAYAISPDSIIDTTKTKFNYPQNTTLNNGTSTLLTQIENTKNSGVGFLYIKYWEENFPETTEIKYLKKLTFSTNSPEITKLELIGDTATSDFVEFKLDANFFARDSTSAIIYYKLCTDSLGNSNGWDPCLTGWHYYYLPPTNKGAHSLTGKLKYYLFNYINPNKFYLFIYTRNRSKSYRSSNTIYIKN